MDKMTKKIIGVFAVILLVAAVILGFYFVLNRQVEEDALPDTEIGKLLAKDLETKYPETPTEVVKLYWRINCCMYNEDMSDSDFEKLLQQLRLLYDEEFLAEEDNSYKTMLKNFKSDKKKRTKAEQTLSSYNVQKNSSVEVETLEERECATVSSSILIKAKGDSEMLYEQFMCRKSEDGDWKILGWQQIDQDTANEDGVE